MLKSRLKTCTVPDCQTPAVAKGLCAKHNMRLRRHGDPATVKPAKRPDRDANWRARNEDLSDRTFARLRRAFRLLRIYNLDFRPLSDRCGKADGSLNVARFLELAEGMVFGRMIMEEDEKLNK